MDILKLIFPFSFTAKDNQSFIRLLVLFVIGVIVTFVLAWLLNFIPIVRILTNLIFGIVGLWLLVSLILGVLVFLGVLKDE